MLVLRPLIVIPLVRLRGRLSALSRRLVPLPLFGAAGLDVEFVGCVGRVLSACGGAAAGSRGGCRAGEGDGSAKGAEGAEGEAEEGGWHGEWVWSVGSVGW